MINVAGADYEATPQIDDGLDVTVTGTILLQSSSSPITSGLGVLSSTVSIDQSSTTTGPTPVATSGGEFTVTIPIATLRAAVAGIGIVFVTVRSSVTGSRPWIIFLRPWLQAEIDAVETTPFIVGQDESFKGLGGVIQDAYTGLWHAQEDIEYIDGRPVAKRMGYKPKHFESEGSG